MLTAEYGVGFTACGVIFFALGILFLFDLALLALGNILFVLGVVLIIGPGRTLYFFARPTKIKPTLFFFGGILLILMKRSFIGFMVESVGILFLFGDFLASIIQFLRLFPVIGPVLKHPYVAPYLNRWAGLDTLPV